MNKIFYHHNNCDGGYGFPYGRPGCDGHKHDDCCDNVPKSPLPPPIPPVRYIPGVNVQEQMCHMAERVNTCIHRWNEIQCECYKALDEVVGAAVSNSVYYSPKEVRYVEGYDEETGCAYELVVISKQDKAGRPIHMRLAPAYFNVTNSGAVQRITDASFVTSAQAMISAVPYDTARWEGPMMCGGKPGSGIVNRNIYVAGWTQSGALRFFMGDATTEQLCRNKIVDAMGPVYPCVNDGEDYKEGYQSLPNRAGSVQAIGYRNCDGAKIMFSCGVQEEVGMAPVDVARVLVSMGVTTAVITSHKLPYDQEEQEGAGMNESGKAGTDKTGPDYRAVGNDGEIQLTNNAGMVFLGKQTDAPLMYKVPQGVGFWFVSKKPMPGYKNDFETEVADSIQRMGNMSSDVQNVIGGIGDTDLSGLVDDVAGLEQSVTRLDGQVTAIQSQVEEVKVSVERLTTALADEVTAREQGDANNKALIDAEAATRLREDQKLQAAIEAESRARETGDDAVRELVTQEQAARQAADAALSTRIDSLATGQGIATATKTRLGVVKIGDNITVKADGTISADAGLSLAEGNGIKLTQTGKVTTVSADTAVLGTKDEVQALQEADTEIEARLDGIDTEINGLDATVQGKVSKSGDVMTGELTTPGVKTDSIKAENGVLTLTGVVEPSTQAKGSNLVPQVMRVTGVTVATDDYDAVNKKYVDSAKQEIVDAIADGQGLPIASTEKLGIIRVGANLSISDDGTLSANSGGTGEGNTVAPGTGIKVSVDEGSKVATVSLNQATQASLAQIPNKAEKSEVALKADKSALTALEGTVTANRAITDANTQNIDALTTTVGTHGEDIAKLKTDLEAVDDVATEAMTTATDAETKAVSAEEQATTAKAAADAAKASAEAATEAVGGKVNRSGDTMTGTLTAPSFKTDIVNIRGGQNRNETSLHITKPTGRSANLIRFQRDGDFGWKIIGSNNVGVSGTELHIAVPDPSQFFHAASKGYVDGHTVPKTGGSFSGEIASPSYKTNLTRIYSTNVGGRIGIEISDENASSNPYCAFFTKTTREGRPALGIYSSSGNVVPDVYVNVPTTPAHPNHAASKSYVDSMVNPPRLLFTSGTFTGSLGVSGSYRTFLIAGGDYIGAEINVTISPSNNYWHGGDSTFCEFTIAGSPSSFFRRQMWLPFNDTLGSSDNDMHGLLLDVELTTSGSVTCRVTDTAHDRRSGEKLAVERFFSVFILY